MKYNRIRNIKLRLWWSDKTTLEKIFFVIRLILTAVLIVSAVLFSLDVWNGHWSVYISCFVILCLISAYEDWNERRVWAIIQLCEAVLISALLLVLELLF